MNGVVHAVVGSQCVAQLQLDLPEPSCLGSLDLVSTDKGTIPCCSFEAYTSSTCYVFPWTDLSFLHSFRLCGHFLLVTVLPGRFYPFWGLIYQPLFRTDRNS